MAWLSATFRSDRETLVLLPARFRNTRTKLGPSCRFIWMPLILSLCCPKQPGVEVTFVGRIIAVRHPVC